MEWKGPEMSAKKSTVPDGMCMTCLKAPVVPNTPQCRPCAIDKEVKTYGVTRVLAMYAPIRSENGFSCIRCRKPIPPLRVEHGDDKTCIGCRETLEKIDPTMRRVLKQQRLTSIPPGQREERSRTRSRRLIRAEGAHY